MKVYKNTLLSPITTPLFEGYGPAEEKLETDRPIFRWRGTPLPWGVLGSVVGFFKWAAKEHKSEAQMRLFYGPSIWRAQVNPQEVSGATTKELERLPSPGGVEVGTIHSHNNFGASQSGTDHKDEEGTNGVHITIGNVDSDKLTWHMRAYYRGIEHQVGAELFQPTKLELNGTTVELPVELVLENLPALLGEFLAFPEEWKTRLEEPRPTPAAVSFPGSMIRRIPVGGFRVPAFDDDVDSIFDALERNAKCENFAL